VIKMSDDIDITKKVSSDFRSGFQKHYADAESFEYLVLFICSYTNEIPSLSNVIVEWGESYHRGDIEYIWYPKIQLSQFILDPEIECQIWDNFVKMVIEPLVLNPNVYWINCMEIVRSI